MAQNHALVLGASGISGWALLNQLRSYPSAESWRRITGTTNRPFSLEQARLPADNRFKLVSGIDLTEPVDRIVQHLRNKVSDIDSVTHVFYTAYIQKDDFQQLKEVNTKLLRNTVEALEIVAPNLQSIILQTGGKGYGLKFPKEVKISPPLHEDMPRIPHPWYDNIFYYTQYDTLKEMAAGKNWTFTEIRPDGIVGFVPGSNAMNMAQGIAIYLSLCRSIHGEGAEIAFPGYEHGYHSTHSDTSQDLLTKMEIYASLNPKRCGNGRVFNIADKDEPVTWASVWPGICSYFGLKGVPPQKGSQGMEQFVQEHMGEWQAICSSHGLDQQAVKSQNWGHVHFMLVQFDFDRQYDLSRAREAGFTESIDTVEGYRIAFERMVAAKIIPDPQGKDTT